MTNVDHSDFICSCSEQARSACQGLSYFRAMDSKPFCVLHYPGNDKLEAFEGVLRKKLDNSDFNFSEAWFPAKVNMQDYDLSHPAFDHATFAAAANFAGSRFLTANFLETTFL